MTQVQAPGNPGEQPRPLAIPTTFGGVAAVAHSPAWRLLAWQAAVALLAAVVIQAGLASTWGRSLTLASAALPERGEILDGTLQWPAGNLPVILHRGPFLGLAVQPAGAESVPLTADVTLTLQARHLVVGSLLGRRVVAYPSPGRIPLDRYGFTGLLEAWWTPVLIGGGVVIFAGLFLVWRVLALVCGAVVWIPGLLGGRPLPFGVVYRLAGAALLPGAMLMIAAFALYATRQVDLLGLLVAMPAHLVLGGVFLLGGWRHARRLQDAPNPFANPPRPRNSDGGPGDSDNPFRPSHAP